VEFPPTFWTVIRRAGTDPQGAREQVVRRYWRPIFEYFRLRGLAHEDAEDLTQVTFLQICRDDFLERADRSKGKFRTLLLAVANHVLDSDWRRAYALKRGGGLDALPLDKAILEIPERKSIPTSAEFDRAWAENLMTEALSKLGPPHREAVEQHYLSGRSYAQIASALRKREDDVKNLIFRGKARLRELVRGLIQEYACDDEHIEEELRDLRSFLG
jgi:RNA polymerase sigma-70 factor (ECF subfamily)